MIFKNIFFVKYLRLAMLSILLLGIYSTPVKADKEISNHILSITHQYDWFLDGNDIGNIRIIRSKEKDSNNQEYWVDELTIGEISGFWEDINIKIVFQSLIIK